MIKQLLMFSLPIVFLAAHPGYAEEHHHHHQTMEAGQALTGDSVYNLTAKWTTQAGHKVRLGSFIGQPVVLAMMYTSCKDMCPLTIEQIRKIEDDVARQSLGPVAYVLVSFDSANDTPGHLKQFAAVRGLDTNNWTLMNGDPDAVRQLAAILGISYRKIANAEFDHSYAITLLDKQGLIAHQQTGLQPDTKEFVDRIRALHLDQR